MLYHAIFKNACPNCGGEIDDYRLYHALPCRRCLSDDEVMELFGSLTKLPERKIVRRVVYEYLKAKGRLGKYGELAELELKLDEIDNLFHKVTGSRLWSAQRTWVKRVLKGKSFAIIAPTGVGKTMFGMLMSVYLALRGKKCYILLPTSVLVKQVYERISEMVRKIGADIKIVAYLPDLSRKEKVEVEEEIKNGNFHILITTSQYMARNFDTTLKGKRFDFIFVDDVDALLRASRNIDRVLLLLGFTEEDLQLGLEVIRSKLRLAFYNLMARKSEEYKEKFKELMGKVKALSQELKERVKKRKHGILIVSSATGRPRGLRVRLFRELLGFEAGSRSEFIRNIADLYTDLTGSLEEKVLEIVKIFGTGGLIFVPLDKGREYAKKLCDYLCSHGIKAELLTAERKKNQIERFVKGELDVLIGMATYYGLLVRGLDLPERIRYAVFAGVPKLRFRLEAREAHPFRIASLLSDLRDYIPQKKREEVDKLLGLMLRYLRELPLTRIREIREAIEKGVKLEGRLGKIQELFERGYEIVKELLESKEVREQLKKSPYLDIEEQEGKLRVIVPDAMTYIQASGRTSRMFAGGISKGASIVIVDNKKVFEGLVRKTRWFIEDIEWKRLEEVDVKKLISEIDDDRRKIRLLHEGKIVAEFKEPVKSALLVVESPSKARTIAYFFGRPTRRRMGKYVVYETSTGGYILTIAASAGHVYDLTMLEDGIYGVRYDPKDKVFIPVYDSLRRCLNCGETFTSLDECPFCHKKEYFDKMEIINMLRELASEVDILLIGTDPDTEGEKIGWDIALLLSPYVNEIKRIEFHEVTKRAIMKALANPRDIDMNLVKAQIVRRLEDRWLGFALSKKLQENADEIFERSKLLEKGIKKGAKTLSAGRVQTPVLGWIIERYHQHLRSFKRVFWVRFKVNDREIVVPLENIKLVGGSIKKTQDYLKDCVVKVEKVEVGDVEEIKPPPPFTTDMLLKEASDRLGFSASDTMRIAQDLFEYGLITYHRTDSIRVSAVGMALAKQYIAEKYGEEYYQGREWGKGGAHECIRPTRPLDVDRLGELLREGIIRTPQPLTRNHFRLYNLIFFRFIASQMKPAKIRRAKLILRIGEYIASLEGIAEILYDGFMKAWDIPENILPKVKEGEEFEVIDVTYARIPETPLYSDGDVVSLMKNRGIGRPSTYAKIIATLLKRKYVIESKQRKKLIPTRLGEAVYEFLVEQYRELISEETTRVLEEKMDMVAEGKVDYQEVLREIYEEIKNIA